MTSIVQTGGTRSGLMDQGQMRASNMGLILRHLRAEGGRSRAQLASETGMSKSTVSSVISDLSERGLVVEGAHARNGSVGRPGQIVMVDGSHVAGVGVEINVDYIALTAMDLAGRVIREVTTPISVQTLSVDAVLDRVAALTKRNLDSLAASGMSVVAVRVAVTGVIDYEDGSVRFAPNLAWRNVPLLAELERRLGPDAPPLQMENDAKLAAVAEYSAYALKGIEDLLYLTGDVGVGAGIIAGGQLVRGWSGFSGEVGHMPLDPEGRPCACGRRGCWETMIGLPALFRLAGSEGDEVADPTLPLEDRLQLIQSRVQAGDAKTKAALGTISTHLATGLGILVDVLNPRVVVLGGYFAYFGDELLPPLAEALEKRRMDQGSSVQLAVSAMGIISASRGGAQSAIECVYADPTLVEVLPEAR